MTKEPDDRAKERIEARILVAKMTMRMIEVAKDRGELEGRRDAYRDVNTMLGSALANAEDELARAPTSDLVMGEIMALRRVAAHFEAAPVFYEHRLDEQRATETALIDHTLAHLRELVAANLASTDAEQDSAI
ncbi:hypothetical protein [Paraburkholderia tropica]|uniref:hypothetical protein n=1 Tax=Paraburkholderia tropica TaxID=92647 RepID=UPI002AB6DC5B|nr:hypothetical protein [Paraburkholderia tropica]